LQTRGDADQRPIGDLALSDEGHRPERADHQDVGPGQMVGYEQHGVVVHRLAYHANADAQRPAQQAIIRCGDTAPARQV